MTTEEIRTTSIVKVVIAIFILVLAVSVGVDIAIKDHWFQAERKQEERHAEKVGADPLPEKKLEISIQNSPHHCQKIESAEFQGDEVWVYIRNTCRNRIEANTHEAYVVINWQAVSSDNTVIQKNWTNNLYEVTLDSGQRTELHFAVHADARTAKWTVSVSNSKY